MRDQFERCSVPECPHLAGDPPHLDAEGKPICAAHAVALSQGRCAWCGEPLNPRWHGLDSYPSKEGKAYCLECWTSEGYGYPMRAKGGA